MPYIKQEARVRICETLSNCESLEYVPPGDLNFAISDMLNDWLIDNGGISYTNVNALIGVLECAKLELYRRVLSPYEDQKCHDNGEVYTAR